MSNFPNNNDTQFFVCGWPHGAARVTCMVLLVLSGVTCRCYLYSGVTCMGVTGFGQGLLVGITCIMGLLVLVLLVLVRGYL